MGVLLKFPKGGKVLGRRRKQPVTGKPEAGDGPQPVAKGEYVAPIDILQAALENVKTIDRIVLLMTDQEGNLGLVSNLDGPAENLMFIEGVKGKIIASQYDTTGFKPVDPKDRA